MVQGTRSLSARIALTKEKVVQQDWDQMILQQAMLADEQVTELAEE